MPFIRSTRDKRGYETTYVMHAYRPAQGQARTRVLYFFRSPAHVRVGRRPLDEESREALTHTHPDLTFDWNVLGRESAPPPRVDEREGRDGRDARGRDMRRPRPEPPARPAEVAAPLLADDRSLLGRTLGAAAAARLRERYADALQRIARRARTPEDRDRLNERAHRLNPDDWADEAAIRGHAEAAEAEWDAVLAELPQRRRGRRGGRRRQGHGEASPGAAEAGTHPAPSPGASAIIEEGGDGYEGSTDDEGDVGGGHDGRGDDDRAGTGDAAESGAEAGHGAASPDADLPGDR